MGQGQMTHGSLKAVLFDFDGTLTRPGALDFGHIRQVLGCPPGTPILEHIDSLGPGPARQAALARLDRFELQGAADSLPNTGAEALVTWLKMRRLAVGIITRNSRACVLRALQNFPAIGPHDFDVMVTRDDPPAPKPSADGILWAARRLGVPPARILVVGDFVFDAQAGQAAGALTALLDPNGDERLQGVAAGFRIKCLEEVRAIVGLF